MRRGPFEGIPARGERVRHARNVLIVHRIFTTSFASVYPLYVAKVQKKGRSQDELDEVIRWLTGFDDANLAGT